MDSYKEELKKVKLVLNDHPLGLTVSDVADSIGVNRNSAAKYLDILKISGSVDVRIVGPAKLYTLSTRIPACSLVDFTSDYILVFNDRLDLIKSGPGFIELTGLNIDEIHEVNIIKLLEKLFSNNITKEDVSNSLSGNTIKKTINCIIHNIDYHFNIKLTPIVFEFGEKGVAIIMEDITKQVKYHEDIQKSKELFEKTFESQHDAIFILDAQIPPQVTNCNNAAEDMFQYLKEEIIGSTTERLHVDKQSLKDFQAKIYPVIQAKGSVKVNDYEMKRKDGTIFPTDHTISSLNNDSGERIGWVSIVQDLSDIKNIQYELEKSEQFYRTFIDTTSDAVIISDPDGLIKSWNKGASELLGYSKEEIIGKPISILAPLDEIENQKKIQNELKTKGSIQNMPTFRLTKSKEKIKVAMTVSLMSIDGLSIGMSAILRKI